MMHLQAFYKSLLLAGVLCMVSINMLCATTPAVSMDNGLDSLASLREVKQRAVLFLLGGGGAGTYRQKAVQENDELVEEMLERHFEPIVWDEKARLTMNERLLARAAELKKLATAFRSQGSRYENSPELKQLIEAGIENILEYFNPASPRPGNWHPWLISIPNHLGATGILMESSLPTELLKRLRASLRDQLSDKMVLTGTNAAWESRNHIYLALLDNDPDRLRRAADYVFATVRYGTKQGVREDYCHLFHGHLPYAGGYGAGFAQTVAEFIYVFDGSSWAMSPVHLDIVINLLLEHTRWFIADGQIDLHVRGRSFKERSNLGQVLEALVVLAQTGSSRRQELANTAAAALKASPSINLNLTAAGFADKIKAVDRPLPSGFRYWPTGEIGVFKQPGFHIGFRQFSERVQDYEYLGREDSGKGEEGWNLAYGFTNILREDGTGSWYSDDEEGAMLPTIDMEHLPGTTSRIGGNPVNQPFQPDAAKVTMSTTGFSLNFGTSSFAGGAGWEDGGVAGFILEPAYGNFIAKKSLHFFPEGFWALGSDIASTAQSTDMADKPIHTTVLQWVASETGPVITLPDRSLTLQSGSRAALEKVPWLWLGQENVAVVFNEPTDIHVRLVGEVITVWLDHGVQPSAARYAYAVLPDISLEGVMRFVRELPFRPIRHDEKVHAVGGNGEQEGGIVFFEPESCMGISSLSPSIVYRKDNGDGGILAVQDPLHQMREIEMVVEPFSGIVTSTDPAVTVEQLAPDAANIKVSTVLGRMYRLGYGTAGKEVYSDLRKDLDLSSYQDFKVEAESDADKTILTVHLPQEAVRNGYRLSVHFSKSQRLYDFSEADVIDKPSATTVRYRWDRNPADGPAVFADYLKQTTGRFNVYLVTQLIEVVDSFTVPDFEDELP